MTRCEYDRSLVKLVYIIETSRWRERDHGEEIVASSLPPGRDCALVLSPLFTDDRDWLVRARRRRFSSLLFLISSLLSRATRSTRSAGGARGSRRR